MTREELIKLIRARESFYAHTDFIGHTEEQLKRLADKLGKKRAPKRHKSKQQIT